MKPNFSFSFFHFQKSLKLISMCNLVPPRRLFLFFDKYIVTWEKFKKVKTGFSDRSSCSIQLGCGRPRKILVGSEVVCKDPLRRMVRKLCWLMSKWFYTDFFLLCLFRVDFPNRIKLNFCVFNFRWWLNIWINNVRSGEALCWVEVCFYFGGKFSVLGGWWLVIWKHLSLIKFCQVWVLEFIVNTF